MHVTVQLHIMSQKSIELNEIRKLDEILRQCEIYVSKNKQTPVQESRKKKFVHPTLSSTKLQKFVERELFGLMCTANKMNKKNVFVSDILMNSNLLSYKDENGKYFLRNQYQKTPNNFRMYHKISRTQADDDDEFAYRKSAKADDSQNSLDNIKNCLHENLKQGKKYPTAAHDARRPTQHMMGQQQYQQQQQHSQLKSQGSAFQHASSGIKSKHTHDSAQAAGKAAAQACDKCEKQRHKAVLIQTSSCDNLSEKSRKMNKVDSYANQEHAYSKSTMQSSCQTTPEERRRNLNNNNNNNNNKYKFSSQIFGRKLSSKHVSEHGEDTLDKEALLSPKIEIKFPDPVETVK